jgi:hypothetical protein
LNPLLPKWISGFHGSNGKINQAVDSLSPQITGDWIYIYIHIYIYTYLYLMYQFSIDYAKSCGFVCVLTMILIVTNCKQVKHVQRFTTVQWNILDLEVAPPSTLSWPWWGKKPFRRNKKSGWWCQPLWKIWNSVGMIIPNIWKNKKCSKPPSRQCTCLDWLLQDNSSLLSYSQLQISFPVPKHI